MEEEEKIRKENKKNGIVEEEKVNTVIIGVPKWAKDHM